MMKAIILAAGVGKRFHSSGSKLPKCLLKVRGRTLLERGISALTAAGVGNIVVVVGYCARAVIDEIGDRCGTATVQYITNNEYTKGAILSLWAARNEVDGDLLIMDADVLFPVSMIKRLVNSEQPNCFLLDPASSNTGEEQMLLTRQGRVETIVRGGSGDYDLVGESVGFLRVCHDDAQILFAILEEFVNDGQDNIEHEEAYPKFLAECWVGFERVDDLPWTEIDFPEDLERAEKEIMPKIDSLDRPNTG